jgi:hypothetical protein
MVSLLIKSILTSMILLSLSYGVLASSMVGGSIVDPSSMPISLDLGGNDTIYDHIKNNVTSNSSNVSEFSTSGEDLSGYASLGDIIKANDWVALEKYTKSVDATTPIEGSETPSSEALRGMWDSYFSQPQTYSISCNC